MQKIKTLQQPRYRWVGLLFVAVSLLVISINDTILNVSLPVIAAALNASASDLQWIQDAYILVFAVLLLTMGSLSDRFGRKRFLQYGVLAFGIFSIMAAMSKTTEFLIVARALQGIGGAIIMPSTLSIISAMFTEPRERAKAIAIWSAMFGLGVAIGPMIGGALLEIPGFNWKGIFLINLPFVVVALIGGYVFLPESRDDKANKPDVVGVLLSIVGLFLLVFAIIKAGEVGWGRPIVWGGLLASFVIIAVFIVWEKKMPNAMLPLELFKNPSFTGASVSMMITLFGLIGLTFFLPQFFQGIQGYTPLETGIRLLPQALLSVLVSWNSHHIINRFGVKRSMFWGLLITAIGMLYLILTLHADINYWILLIGLVVFFFGIDIALPAATVSIMGSVPVKKAGMGSGMNEMTGHIGGALGIAILGALLNRVYLNKVSGLEGLVPEGIMLQVRSSIFGAQQALEGMSSNLIMVAEDAFVSGMRTVFITCFVIFFVLSMLAGHYLPEKIQCSEDI